MKCPLTLSSNKRWFSLVLFFKNFIYLCIYVCMYWLRRVFLAARGLSLVVASGGYSSVWCAGLSLRWLLLLRSTRSRHAGFSSCSAGSVVVARGLQSAGSVVVAHGLSCSSGMWDLPGPGLEPVSPALAGGFLTTAPSGKPQEMVLTVSETLVSY